jgi:hypothetical protein
VSADGEAVKKDPGPFVPPPNLHEMPREMLIDCIHRLIAGMNQLRDQILRQTSQHKRSDTEEA